MNTQSPRTLLHLAVQSPLRGKDLVIRALEELPREFFLPLFREAFAGGHTEVLKALVPTGPFPCLPLGALMKIRNTESSQTGLYILQLLAWDLRTFQAGLDGLDALLARKVCPRRWQLQVLGTQNMYQNFRGAETSNLAPQRSQGGGK